MRGFVNRVGRFVGVLITLSLALVIVLGLFGLGFSAGVGDRYAQLRDADTARVFDLAVGDVGPSSITLTVVDDDDSLTRNGRWGLELPGGYGQIGDIVSRVEGAVTRAFTLVEGDAPAAGSVARLDAGYWRGDPSVLGIPFSEVAFTTELGSYPAWLTEPVADTWLIVVHHQAADRQQGLRLAKPATDAGLTTMLITYRNDRDAPGGPVPRYQWGVAEWRDLEGAVRYALANGADRVVLAGYGMGGSIVLSFLRESSLASRTVGAILDAPVIDLAATVRSDISRYRLGNVLDMPSVINEAARVIAGWRFDIDWGAADYDEVAVDIPILIFHGDRDLVTPVGKSREFAASSPDTITLVVVPDAGFGEAWNLDPAAYEAATTTFLEGL